MLPTQGNLASLAEVLGAAALLAVSADQPWLWFAGSCLPTLPAWLPRCVLIALGVLSCGFGLLYPEAVAAVASEGFWTPLPAG